MTGKKDKPKKRTSACDVAAQRGKTQGDGLIKGGGGSNGLRQPQVGNVLNVRPWKPAKKDLREAEGRIGENEKKK